MVEGSKKVVGLVEFDGHIACSGRLRMNISSCWVENDEDSVGIPNKFAVLLLNEAIKDEAYRLLDAAIALTGIRFVRDHILEKAYAEGFEEAWKLVERLRVEKPDGTPKFYQASTHNFAPRGDELVLTDGNDGFKFDTDFNVDSLKLPLNAYVEPMWTGFTLTRQRYEEAYNHLKEFFTFTSRLMSTVYHISSGRKHQIFEAFFMDRAKAYTLLKAAETDAKHRQKREELYNMLEKERVLKTSNGYIAYAGWHDVYYVSENGEVYKLNYENTGLREAVLRLWKTSKIPKKVSKGFTDSWDQQKVIEAIGKINPALALILAP
jgi:hypothetical protein